MNVTYNKIIEVEVLRMIIRDTICSRPKFFNMHFMRHIIQRGFLKIAHFKKKENCIHFAIVDQISFGFKQYFIWNDLQKPNG